MVGHFQTPRCVQFWWRDAQWPIFFPVLLVLVWSILLFGTFLEFINSALKRYPCLANLADSAFTAYFVHHILVVDAWVLAFFSLPKNRPMVLGELKDPFGGLTRTWFIGQFYQSDPLSLRRGGNCWNVMGNCCTVEPWECVRFQFCRISL